jgi:hypothetical protein
MLRKRTLVLISIPGQTRTRASKVSPSTTRITSIGYRVAAVAGVADAAAAVPAKGCALDDENRAAPAANPAANMAAGIASLWPESNRLRLESMVLE